MDKVKLAWAAGFYDGEGSVCCTFNNGNPHTRIQLSIGQKNDGNKISESLKKFKAIVGCGYIYRKSRSNKEINQHQFCTCKYFEVKSILDLLWIYLSTPKKRQARRAFSLFKKGHEALKLLHIQNKDLIKENRSKAHKGQIPWNKGKVHNN